MSFAADFFSESTYSVEPIRPSSSAPHQARRILFFGSMPSSVICCAISSRVALPVPLSLIPGPSATLSRCAPAMTTCLALPPGDSAITFSAVRSSECVVVLM